jgi:hypothetical protein
MERRCYIENLQRLLDRCGSIFIDIHQAQKTLQAGLLQLAMLSSDRKQAQY